MMQGLRVGRARAYADIAVAPLFLAEDVEGDGVGPDYITLGEALEAGTLVIAEKDGGGSVPELLAVNDGAVAVLILDGEELKGAKQNRVLNATMLIGAKSSVIVPVSCVEAGRWRSVSSRFSASGHHAANRVRRATAESVDRNLRGGAGYRSDQGAVWGAVSEFAAKHSVASPTSAMSDVFDRYEAEMRTVSDKFPLQPNQAGIIAIRGSKVLGMDVLSRPAAYARLHEKLLRSYAMEATHAEPVVKGAGAVAKAFITTLAAVKGLPFESPGLGMNVRYAAPGVVGSALLYEDTVLHLAAFAVEQARRGRSTPDVADIDFTDEVPNMTAWDSRRQWRR
jgi:hypothetical protein